ncbi:hypothetical protein REPUB_Repub09cG0116000 [Reevesia pubescens]
MQYAKYCCFTGMLNNSSACGGTGANIRDSEGFVLGATTEFHNGLDDPLVVECMAATRALQFAADMGFQHIILERDALMVVNSLTSNEHDQSIARNLILEGRAYFSKFSIKVRHIRREGNAGGRPTCKTCPDV